MSGHNAAQCYELSDMLPKCNQALKLGMSRLIGTADKSADIWRFQNNR